MNGQCCQTRFASLKWPALLVLSLMLIPPVNRPLEAASDSGSETAETRRVESGPVVATVSVDRREVRVADPFHLTITARAPQGVAVQFPEMGERLGEFLVTRVRDAFDVPDGIDRTWTCVLRLESLASGPRELPPVTLTYTDTRSHTASENTGTIDTPSFPINVVSEVEANADPRRFRDIKGVVELVEPKPASYTWVAWTAASAGALVLTGMGLLVIRRRSLTPQQWALQELERLEQSGLIEAGDIDTFFCTVTDVLRVYIERRFAIRAPQLSTSEFLEQAKAHADLDDGQRRLLQTFLKLSDFVKFARFDVTVTDTQRALSHARRFIEETPANLTQRTSPKSAANEQRSLAVSVRRRLTQQRSLP